MARKTRVVASDDADWVVPLEGAATFTTMAGSGGSRQAPRVLEDGDRPKASVKF